MKILAAAIAAAFFVPAQAKAPMPSNMGLVLFADNPDHACKTLLGARGGVALACASIGPMQDGVNRMILPNPCDPAFAGEFFAEVACHETRHWQGEMHAPGSNRFADGG